MKLIYGVPATALLVYRAWSKKSLTPGGLIVATLTAIVHVLHPWNMPFILLCVFFLAGTRATHVKEEVKSKLTMKASGSTGGEGPRNYTQVLANSLAASVLCILHTMQLNGRAYGHINPEGPQPRGTTCFSWGGDVFAVGIIANYAAVCADTLSSELGILARSQPRLVTSWNLRKVPRGTNGGVTMEGLLAGLFGSMLIVTVGWVSMPKCNRDTMGAVGGGVPWTMEQRQMFLGFLVLWGAFGSVVDSFLGGWFQRSVRDVRSGKIVEGENGVRVLTSNDPSDAPGTVSASAADDKAGSAQKYNPKDKHRESSFGDARPSRIAENGMDLLDNNDVNFIMAMTMSTGAMVVAAWYWGKLDPAVAFSP